MIGKQTLLSAQARVGASIHGHTLETLLGVGGMAAVYAAKNTEGERVAVKLLHPELCQAAEIRMRFVQEAEVVNRIRHPGVVHVRDAGEDAAGGAYLVMELLEGETLEQRWQVRGRRLPLEETAHVALGLLSVLDAAHDQGIVHRDVKPANVFLTSNGELKLMDFGIARSKQTSGRTRSGQPMGTPAFMAPEQAGGRVREIDARTDLWAVGAICFWLLSGQEVHPAKQKQQQLIYAATQPARAVASVVPEIDARVGLVIDTALRFDREYRWPSAKTMSAALRESVA